MATCLWCLGEEAQAGARRAELLRLQPRATLLEPCPAACPDPRHQHAWEGVTRRTGLQCRHVDRCYREQTIQCFNRTRGKFAGHPKTRGVPAARSQLCRAPRHQRPAPAADALPTVLRCRGRGKITQCGGICKRKQRAGTCILRKWSHRLELFGLEKSFQLLECPCSPALPGPH